MYSISGESVICRCFRRRKHDAWTHFIKAKQSMNVRPPKPNRIWSPRFTYVYMSGQLLFHYFVLAQMWGVLDQHFLYYLGFSEMSYCLRNLDWRWCIALVCCIGLDILDMAPGGWVGHWITLVSDMAFRGGVGFEHWKFDAKFVSRSEVHLGLLKRVWDSYTTTVIQFNRSCPVVRTGP